MIVIDRLGLPHSLHGIVSMSMQILQKLIVTHSTDTPQSSPQITDHLTSLRFSLSSRQFRHETVHRFRFIESSRVFWARRSENPEKRSETIFEWKHTHSGPWAHGWCFCDGKAYAIRVVFRENSFHISWSSPVILFSFKFYVGRGKSGKFCVKISPVFVMIKAGSLKSGKFLPVMIERYTVLTTILITLN